MNNTRGRGFSDFRLCMFNVKSDCTHRHLDDQTPQVLNKKVGGGAYYKEKGVVIKIHDKYLAEVEILSSGDVLKLDQSDLEVCTREICSWLV